MTKLVLAALLLSGFVRAGDADGDKPRKSPELAFHVHGQGEKLLSQYRGKVVALEFILTTCPHCQAASRVMTKLQNTYGKRGLQVIDVAVDPNADSRVENFARTYEVSFPVGWISIDQMMSYMGFTDRPVVPQLVLIDRSGMIHYQTPREGDAISLKEEIVTARVQELLNLR